MPSWNDLVLEIQALSDHQRGPSLIQRHTDALRRVGELRGPAHQPRNVLLYGSGFLQKPGADGNSLSVMHDDLNGYMSVIYGMDWSRGLTLLLHTPGGNPNAAESVIAYLRSKFVEFEVIIPTLSMSAGTMMSLAADRIVMGRQSQLGPIDPQLTLGGRQMSARGVVEQFERAEREIMANPLAAHVWAPITQSLGPALLQDAQNALDYSETMVAGWLSKWMFADVGDGQAKGAAVAKHFNDASTHKSHGRRIDREEAGAQGLIVEELEANQELQEAVLTAYHTMTLLFEQSQAVKVITGSNDRNWIKNAN